MQKLFPSLVNISPFLMAFGAAAYFTMPFEPKIPGAIFFTIAFLIIAFIKQIPLTLRGPAIIIFGFFYAVTYTGIINTPQMPRTMRDANITAEVANIDFTPDKTRMYLRVNARDIGVDRDDTAMVRLSMAAENTIPRIGDTLSLTATLFRPNPSYAPGAFDYARWTYFNNISATGFIGEYRIIDPTDEFGINSLRSFLHRRANSFLTDSLVLGYKNALPEADRQIWTAAGISHVWSISGFHITLISGWLFALFYMIFRRIPYITRRIPAKFPAFIIAWIGIGLYLLLSGCGVATIRAFAMTTLIFAAFILGRGAISMRNICIAFCMVFLINPHYVMQAGFQLSFSAVFGLIWFWGDIKPKMPKNKILKAVYAATLTSVIATVFTTPFVAAHFYSVPIYGLAGNLILLPIFSVIIMPLVIIGTAFAAIGFNLPLDIANRIYEFALSVAEKISALPGAMITMPHISNLTLMLIIIGFICLLFASSARLRYALGGTFIAIGIITFFTTPRGQVYITPDHELIGFVYDGKLEFNKSRAANHFFAFDTWKQMNGDRAGTPNHRRKCPHGVCIYRSENFNLAYIQKFVPLSKNIASLCADPDIDYIISYFNIRSAKCDKKILRGNFIIYKSGRVKYNPINRRWHNPRA